MDVVCQILYESVTNSVNVTVLSETSPTRYTALQLSSNLYIRLYYTNANIWANALFVVLSAPIKRFFQYVRDRYVIAERGSPHILWMFNVLEPFCIFQTVKIHVVAILMYSVYTNAMKKHLSVQNLSGEIRKLHSFNCTERNKI